MLHCNTFFSENNHFSDFKNEKPTIADGKRYSFYRVPLFDSQRVVWRPTRSRIAVICYPPTCVPVLNKHYVSFIRFVNQIKIIICVVRTKQKIYNTKLRNTSIWVPPNQSENQQSRPRGRFLNYNCSDKFIASNAVSS